MQLQIHACQGTCYVSEPWACTQGWVHCILYVLFENAMGVVKLWAVVAGARSHLALLKNAPVTWAASAPMCSEQCGQ